MIYLPFDQLQTLCGMAVNPKRTSAILIKFKKGTNVHKCTEKVASMWSDFVKRNSGKRQAELFKTVTVQDWKSYKRDSIAPMEKEQTMMIMLFMMVAFITVFIIFVIFYMLIAQKSKDIGILKSIGASGSSITTVFLRFAFLIGFSGTAGGLVFGLLFLAKINALERRLFEKFGWQLWNREVYSIGDIPNRPDFALLTVVFVCAVAVCLVGALLPTIKGASKKCVDILRVNEL